MKVFDEKGKIFGKVNIIDLLVVVALIAVVAAVGWHFLGDQVSDVVATESPTITYEVSCYRVTPPVAEYAATQLDTQLMSQGDLQPGYIRACEVGPSMVTKEDGSLISDENFRNVTFTIEAESPLVANAYALGSQELRTGKTHIVKTVNLEISGVITSMTVEDAND